MCQRAYSIRTRIKTENHCHLKNLLMSVREHIPLEQGLRLIPWIAPNPIEHVREHIPLEQGLRLRTLSQ